MYTSSITSSSALEGEARTSGDFKGPIAVVCVLLFIVMVLFTCGVFGRIKKGKAKATQGKPSETQQNSSNQKNAASVTPKTGTRATSKREANAAPKTETITAPKKVLVANKKKAASTVQTEDIEMFDLSTLGSSRSHSESQLPPPYTPFR